MYAENENEKPKDESILRRDFLKVAGIMAVGAAASGSVPLDEATAKTIDSGGLVESSENDANSPVIDVHRHCMIEASSMIDRAAQLLLFKRLGLKEADKYPSATWRGITSLIYPDFRDINLQVKVQDEAGVTKSLLSFTMLLETFCEVLSQPSEQVARRLNDATAALVAKYPAKLAFMAMVNPFDKSSVNECERCFKEHGAKGISIGTSWKGGFLDSEEINHFWEYAQDKDVAIFLHPPFVPIGSDKMNLYKLEEMVGRPFDTTMTAAAMIFSGVFDRYPKLKIVLPHMGAGLPNIVGRLDFGYRLGYSGLPAGQAAVCKRLPSEYLKTNCYIDTMGFSALGIRHGIDLLGADRVLFGTDYGPVPISPREHIDIVRSLGLSREEEASILWKNAEELFKLT
ncbi:MAG: amidohydrolase family protein [Desulfomonilaceae bacterium]